MKLRNNCLVCSNGVPSWPPAWWWRGGEGNKHPLGEVGVLKDVIPCSVKPSNRCYVIMEDGGAEYLAVLRFDSYSVCQRVYDFLLQHRGESIQQIGEIDLDSFV